jgi:hypothetical protein
MTKMNMIWIAVASMIYPESSSNRTVTRHEIQDRVTSLFGESITPIMVDRHLVSWEDRQADREIPQRGGSRNRYLFRTVTGCIPSREGRFRLYKFADGAHDGWEKTGPACHNAADIDSEFLYLLNWYLQSYAGAS